MAGSRRLFGRVRKLPSGRWQARYPGSDGVDRPAPHTFWTKADATAWLVQVEAAMRRGDWIDPAAGRVQLDEFGTTWIAERPIAPRTRAKYERLWRLHISTSLGRMDLADVTTGHVRAWRTDRLHAGVGRPTVAGAYRLLRGVMATAVDDELIRRNPCRLKGADKEGTPERPVATIPQVFAIADAIQPWYRALVLTAAFTGLRWGELLALRRHHVDTAAGVVAVRGAVLEVEGKLTQGPTKSYAGVRDVALPAAIVPELEKHLGEWSEDGPAGRVFVGPKGATPLRSNFSRSWVAALRKAGIPAELGLHFHDLRHTGNVLASRGASLRDVMGRLGHASTRAALIYQHTDAERQREIAANVSAAIEASLDPGGHVAGTEAADRPGDAEPGSQEDGL